MFKYFLVLILLLCSTHLWAKKERVLRGNGAVAVAEVIAREQCNSDYLRRSSEAYLAREKTSTVVWVGFFTDPEVALDIMAGEGRTEVGFEYWRKMHSDRASSARSGSCGELVKIGERATVRLAGKTASETPSDIPITGKNVFFWRIGGRDFQLVHIGFSEVNTGVSKIEKHLFLTTKEEVDVKLGESVFTYLSRQIGNSDLTVQLRQEDYFIGSLKYPWVNPFIPESLVPTWEAFQKSQEVFCSHQSPQKPCMGNMSRIVPR